MLRKLSHHKNVPAKEFAKFIRDLDNCNVSEISRYIKNYGHISKAVNTKVHFHGKKRSPIETTIFWVSGAPTQIARERYLDILKLLLSAKAITVNTDAISPLNKLLRQEGKDHWIAQVADVLLKDKRAYKNTYQRGRTPFLGAVLARNTECISLLIGDMEVDVNAQFITEKKDDINDLNGVNALMLAATYKKDYVGLGEALLARKDIDVNRKDANGNTAFSEACHNRNQVMAALLAVRKDLRDVNNPDCDGHIPLSRAIDLGWTDVVDALLQRSDIDVNAKDSDGKTPLMHALEHHDLVTAGKLLARADIQTTLTDDQGHNALHYAVKHEDCEILKLLLARPEIDAVVLNARDNHKCGLLLHALNWRNVQAGFLLLDTGKMDVNQRDGCGETVLMSAMDEGSMNDLILKLIELGADIHLEADNGDDLLMNAGVRENMEMFKLLLDKGVDPNRSYRDGDTILDMIIRDPRPGKSIFEMIDLLVKHGADLERKNPTTGMRPCEMAAAVENFGVLMRLLSLSRKPGKQVSIVSNTIFKPVPVAEAVSAPEAEQAPTPGQTQSA